MGKLNVASGSPLKLRFEDDAGNPIDSIEINGSKLRSKGDHWFVTDIDVHGRENINVFRVTDVGRNQATIEFRCGA